MSCIRKRLFHLPKYYKQGHVCCCNVRRGKYTSVVRPQMRRDTLDLAEAVSLAMIHLIKTATLIWQGLPDNSIARRNTKETKTSKQPYVQKVPRQGKVLSSIHPTYSYTNEIQPSISVIHNFQHISILISSQKGAAMHARARSALPCLPQNRNALQTHT